VSVELRISYQAVARVFRLIREIIFLQAELEGKKLSGDVELDESYFGGKRKGKRGRGAAGKKVVFGILERGGRVYTRVVYTLTAENLMAIIKKKTRKGSVFHTDTFKSYNSLKQYGKHLTVNHKKNLVDKNNHNHINGIEGFWSYAKHKMYSYHGVPKANFGFGVPI
jgi:transposase